MLCSIVNFERMTCSSSIYEMNYLFPLIEISPQLYIKCGLYKDLFLLTLLFFICQFQDHSLLLAIPFYNVFVSDKISSPFIVTMTREKCREEYLPGCPLEFMRSKMRRYWRGSKDGKSGEKEWGEKKIRDKYYPWQKITGKIKFHPDPLLPPTPQRMMVRILAVPYIPPS